MRERAMLIGAQPAIGPAPGARHGLGQVLKAQPDLEVVAEATEGTKPSNEPLP